MLPSPDNDHPSKTHLPNIITLAFQTVLHALLFKRLRKKEEAKQATPNHRLIEKKDKRHRVFGLPITGVPISHSPSPIPHSQSRAPISISTFFLRDPDLTPSTHTPCSAYTKHPSLPGGKSAHHRIHHRKQRTGSTHHATLPLERECTAQ